MKVKFSQTEVKSQGKSPQNLERQILRIIAKTNLRESEASGAVNWQKHF
jgi:hypothetical protein